MTSYTIQKTKDHFTLNAVDSKESIAITKEHPKFDYVANQATLVQRIIKFNGTKMTSTKDYYKNYSKVAAYFSHSYPLIVTFSNCRLLNIEVALEKQIEEKTKTKSKICF